MPRTATSFVLLPIAAAIAACGGCASYSGIHGQEHAMVPQALASGQHPVDDGVFVKGDWPRADWWSMFGDPKLNALVSQAFAGNPDLRAAEARVRTTHALAQTARSSLFPTLDLNASAGRERLSDNDIIYGPFAGSWLNQGRVTLDFAYEFDFWGRNRDELSAALGEARAAEADNAAAQLVLATAVAQTYFQLQTDIAAAEVVKQTLAEREGLRDLNRQRASRGLETTIPARQSGQQVASSRVDVSAADAAVQLDRHQLAALLGLGPDAPLDVQPTLRTYDNALALPADLPTDLLARRPDIAAQRFRAEAAAARIGAAKADFYPNINLATFVGFDALTLNELHLFDGGSRSYGVSPALHLPLFEAGRLQANLRGRYGEYDTAIAQYNQTLVQATRQVADQVVSLRAVRRQLTDQADAQAAASDAYRLTLDRYRAGLSNYLDVLINEERLLAERQRQVQLQGRSLTLVVEMIRALGGGYHAPETTAERK
jgi:NodT family efflux transporter outer membrane factor (OMF) lipoprotein